jgi:Spy/CpxP family protein refolding chaperone
MDYFKQNKWLFWIIILLIIVNILTVSMFWINRPQERDQRNNCRGMRHMMPKELNLTALQDSLFDVEQQKHMMQIGPYLDSIRNEKEQLIQLYLKESSMDSALLRSKIASYTAIQTQLEFITYQHFSKLKSYLTPEQQKIFDESIQRMLLDMGSRHSMGRNHHKDDFRPDDDKPGNREVQPD